MKDQFPKEKHDRLINARLVSGSIDISASDWMASPALEPIHGNTFAVYVVGGEYAELKTVFDQLAQGAQKEWFQDLHDLPIGVYGQFFDKYGIQWIFLGDRKNKGSQGPAGKLR
jgi:PhnB protein